MIASWLYVRSPTICRGAATNVPRELMVKMIFYAVSVMLMIEQSVHFHGKPLG